ncbi:hypothetical protein AAFC00_005288 [Neodothiora populina]|uniref:Uncharacterized protein n=1 Tax=Neodothiora populina TaxID=2781224 RepID=A0ABR3PKL4_9PEZI
MTTVVASAPSISVSRDHGLANLAHLAASAPPMVTSSSSSRTTPPGRTGPASAEHSPRSAPRSADGNMSPRSLRPGSSTIKVKKEPSSPGHPASSRPRPRRLDLSASSGAGRGPQSGRPSGPLTAKDSAHLALACLSPGIQTQDPAMREQLQRSMDVREQQRMIIESRQKNTPQRSGAPHESPDSQRTAEGAAFGEQSRAASNPRRKGPPPGLSILAPSAAAFSNERVIQSAPLHQSFTGLRNQPYNQHASGLSQTNNINHVPANQTENRLPPISDVFAHDRLAAHPPPPATARPAMFASRPSPGHAPLHSPSFPPPSQHQHQAQMSGRGREFRSAEEAVQELSRGRDDLLPKIVHYGGTQPPTPPSPMPSHHHHHQQQQQQPQHQHTQQGPRPPSHSHYQPHPSQYASAPHLEAPRQDYSQGTAGRRRGRDEYERDNGSPLRRSESKRASFMAHEDGEADWRSSLTGPEKREEFLRLCARAWDLFHS